MRVFRSLLFDILGLFRRPVSSARRYGMMWVYDLAIYWRRTTPVMAMPLTTMPTAGPVIRLMTTVVLAGIFSSRALADPVQGPVGHFNDGDSFLIGEIPVRLKGIDAPELAQECTDNLGREYRCGEMAAEHLKLLVAGRDVVCRGDERDDYGRLVAYCRSGSTDLNARMVGDGWAVAFVRYDDSFIDAETAARDRGLGIWQGKFQRPEAFRASEWKQARQQSVQADDDCVIKGNITSKGERIYHTPWGSEHYARTRISLRKGERWFCSEAEARAAGWRPPGRQPIPEG